MITNSNSNISVKWVWRALLVLCAQSAPHRLSHTLVSAGWSVERGADRVTKQNSDHNCSSLTPSLPLVLRVCLIKKSGKREREFSIFPLLLFFPPKIPFLVAALLTAAWREKGKICRPVFGTKIWQHTIDDIHQTGGWKTITNNLHFTPQGVKWSLTTSRYTLIAWFRCLLPLFLGHYFFLFFPFLPSEVSEGKWFSPPKKLNCRGEKGKNHQNSPKVFPLSLIRHLIWTKWEGNSIFFAKIPFPFFRFS